MPPEPKQKLTLTVDPEVVDAAKKAGLNISEVTERLLRGYTFDPDEAEKGATLAQYDELLTMMDPLLKKFGCRVAVGEYYPSDPEFGSWTVYRDANLGYYWEEDVNENQSLPQKIDPKHFDFLRPTQILKNFFAAIEGVKSRRREEVEGLLLAKKLVEALVEQEVRREKETQETTGGA